MTETVPSIGFSKFFLDNAIEEMGNSYTKLPPLSLLNYVYNSWMKRTPGLGEGTRIDRKVLVPLDPNVGGIPVYFCPPRVRLVEGMPLRAEAICRQEGEEPFVDVFVTPKDAMKYGYIETPASSVSVVCFSKEALLENNGRRTTNSDWEIVTLLCSTTGVETMEPLTMARNWLELAGGTKPATPYTCDEWAQAVLAAKSKGIKVRRPRG
jgi:hypothetical protein